MHGKRAGGYSGRHNPVEVPRNMKTRIQGTAVVDARTLTPNPANWRTHPQAQLDALEGVLAEVGHVQHVIVNGRTGLIVDGHARVELAASRGDTVPVVYVDLSPEDEALVLATFDPLSAMAGRADALLADLLDQCQTDNPALQALLDSLAPEGGPANVEGVDMPVLPTGDRDPYQQRTFTLHDEQADTVEDAIALARTDPTADTGINENSNGNALTLICRQWLEYRVPQ